MNHILVSNQNWHDELVKTIRSKSADTFTFINTKDKLTIENLKKIDPRYLFFLHWSYIIPAEIYENYECVIFHMTDLPFGRGGSPLQNLIVRGITDTKLSAIKCVKKLDAGPIYLKQDLSLYGNAKEIYLRAGKIMEDMIIQIISNNPVPVPQKGEPVIFKRRTPEQSNIKEISNLDKLFDHIRMLDADGYPFAFLETEHFILKFKRASIKNDRIESEVIIMEKKDEK